MPRAKTPKTSPLTYSELQKQIADLQSQAEQVRKQEIDAVIGRIREAIEVYGLTPDDLFGAPRKAPAGKPRKAARYGASAPTVSAPKYKDPSSEKTWTGRGKRPAWFVAAVEAGTTPEALAV